MSFPRWLLVSLGLLTSAREVRAGGPAVVAASAGGSGVGALAAKLVASGVASQAMAGAGGSTSAAKSQEGGGGADTADAARKASNASRASMLKANTDAKDLMDLWAPARGNPSDKEVIDQVKDTWNLLGELTPRTPEPLEVGKPADLEKRMQRMQSVTLSPGENSASSSPDTAAPAREPHRASRLLRRRSQLPPVLMADPDAKGNK